MTETVETLDGLQRRVTLTLDMAAIETEVNKRLRNLARKVKVDGFRPGKAPIKMVAARYGGEVRGEVVGDSLQQRFVDVVSTNQINVAGYPSFEPVKDEAGNVAFNAVFEVFPEIKLGAVGEIKIARPVVEVTDTDVDRTIEVLRKQRLQYHTVERPAQSGDRAHIDYAGRIDGAVFEGGEAKDFPVVLGEGRTLKEFEGALDGMRPGEEKSFDVTFPDDYFAKHLAGKTATFTARVDSVQEPRLPEIDDAFAASMGVHEGGIAKLREEIAANLRREAKRRIQGKVKEQVMDGLLGVTPFEVPARLVSMEGRAMFERAANDLKQRGLREADLKMDESLFEPQAKRRVALGLLLNKLAETEQIKADAAQVKTLVEEFAQSYEDPAEVVAWYYADPSRLREAQSLALEENIVNWVLERAQVADETTTLENLMGKS